jgi:chemotaxis protein histidine kinase CheA
MQSDEAKARGAKCLNTFLQGYYEWMQRKREDFRFIHECKNEDLQCINIDTYEAWRSQPENAKWLSDPTNPAWKLISCFQLEDRMDKEFLTLENIFKLFHNDIGDHVKVRNLRQLASSRREELLKTQNVQMTKPADAAKKPQIICPQYQTIVPLADKRNVKNATSVRPATPPPIIKLPCPVDALAADPLFVLKLPLPDCTTEKKVNAQDQQEMAQSNKAESSSLAEQDEKPVEQQHLKNLQLAPATKRRAKKRNKTEDKVPEAERLPSLAEQDEKPVEEQHLKNLQLAPATKRRAKKKNKTEDKELPEAERLAVVGKAEDPQKSQTDIQDPVINAPKHKRTKALPKRKQETVIVQKKRNAKKAKTEAQENDHQDQELKEEHEVKKHDLQKCAKKKEKSRTTVSSTGDTILSWSTCIKSAVVYDESKDYFAVAISHTSRRVGRKKKLQHCVIVRYLVLKEHGFVFYKKNGKYVGSNKSMPVTMNCFAANSEVDLQKERFLPDTMIEDFWNNTWVHNAFGDANVRFQKLAPLLSDEQRARYEKIFVPEKQ